MKRGGGKRHQDGRSVHRALDQIPSGIDRPLKSSEAEALTAETLKSLRGKEFLEKSIDYFRKSLETVALRDGYDIGDYSPDRLRIVDDHWLESAKEACAKEGIPPESGVLWSMYHGVGSYFGTVIIRNLGGRWRTPSTLTFWLSQALARPGILFNHWYVEVKGEKIPVFRIARWRCDGSGRVRSLAEAYEKIASGKSWSD